MSPKKSKKKKKSKNKKNILARMTVDQRRQYLEKKAAQEQEKIRRREELLAGFLKLKLEDEQNHAKVIESRLTVKWRQILRQVKTKSVKSQLENLKLWTDESVESHDRTIGLLNECLLQALEQGLRNSYNNLNTIRKIAAIHDEHLTVQNRQFSEQEVRLITAVDDDVKALKMRQENLEATLLAVQESAELEAEKAEEEESEEYENQFARIKTKLIEEADIALKAEEQSLEKVYKNLTTTLKKCNDETGELKSECNSLQDKVLANQKTFEKLQKEINETKADILTWKNQITAERDGVLNKDKEDTDMTWHSLRLSLNKQILYLRECTKKYNDITEKSFGELSKTMELGEEIISLAHAARRLETSKDKEFPYLQSIPIHAEALHGESSEQVVRVSDLSRKSEKTHLRGVQESDSGCGSSITASSTLQVEDTMKRMSGSEMPQDPESCLPKDTLTRILTMLKEENMFQEVSGASKMKDFDPNDPQSDYIDKETEFLMRIHESLAPFWFKFNNVQVQKLSLSKEADDLIVENKRLKQALKEYLMLQGLNEKSCTSSESPLSISGVEIKKCKV